MSANIDTLVGRELHDAVERAVFGRCPHVKTETHDLGPDVRGIGVTCSECGAKPGSAQWSGSVFPYSSSWEGFGRVLDAMGRRHYWCEITVAPNGDGTCKFERSGVPGVEQNVPDWLPRSICRAALAALWDAGEDSEA